MREKLKDDKIQTGLRIPEAQYIRLKKMADRSGVSLNAVILQLVDIGLVVLNLGSEEVRRSGLQNQQHSGEQ